MIGRRAGSEFPNLWKYDREKIKSLCDGQRTSKEIAEIVGCSAKYVQAQMKKYNLPRLPQSGRRGEKNPAYKFGKIIDRDGYVLVSASSAEYPNARRSKKNKIGRVLEHRYVMELKIGRYLQPREVVDHIDGCHLNNHPDNLRFFATNADHLRSTLSGYVPNWTENGFENMKCYRLPKDRKRVDTYNQRKKLGEIRLLQILLAHALLDKESPYLLGTHRYLETAGIDFSSHSKIEQAVVLLHQKWGLDPSEFLSKMNL